ncbi:hypothetical protein RI367_000614 [Sorochytrium milnesiophthora]
MPHKHFTEPLLGRRRGKLAKPPRQRREGLIAVLLGVSALLMCARVYLLFLRRTAGNSIYRQPLAITQQTCQQAWQADDGQATCSCEAQCVVNKTDLPCCSDYVETSALGVDFLLQKGLIRVPRRDLGGNMTMQWMLERAVEHPLRNDGTLLAVMRQCVLSGATNTLGCNDYADVLGLEVQTGAVSRQALPYAFHLFNRSVTPAESMRAAVGSIIPQRNASTLPSNLYYMQLDSDSSADVAKLLMTGITYCGFKGILPSTGEKPPPLAFDPTPGRDWGLQEGTFSLHRGAISNIANDITSEQLDKDYDGAIFESKGVLLPWNSCYLRKVWCEKEERWLDVYDDKGQMQRLPPALWL